MRRDLFMSVLLLIAATVVLGIGYPLLVTGAAQLALGSRADGSLVRSGGEVRGSRLVAQAFPGDEWFQPRPSQTEYAADATAFANLGPNSKALADLTAERMEAYLERERAGTPDLERADVPVDAVTNSASGIDPHVSLANARIQARRVAEERDAPIDGVLGLVDDHVAGRALWLFGEPGVNVLELNLELDRKYPTR